MAVWDAMQFMLDVGRGPKEVAQRLGMPLSAFSQSLSRGRTAASVYKAMMLLYRPLAPAPVAFAPVTHGIAPRVSDEVKRVADLWDGGIRDLMRHERPEGAPRSDAPLPPLDMVRVSAVQHMLRQGKTSVEVRRQFAWTSEADLQRYLKIGYVVAPDAEERSRVAEAEVEHERLTLAANAALLEAKNQALLETETLGRTEADFLLQLLVNVRVERTVLAERAATLARENGLLHEQVAAQRLEVDALRAEVRELTELADEAERQRDEALASAGDPLLTLIRAGLETARPSAAVEANVARFAAARGVSLAEEIARLPKH